MITRKNAFASALISLALVSAVGCGSQSASSSKTPKDTGKVSLELLNMWAQYKPQMDDLKKTYEKTHPNVNLVVNTPSQDINVALSARIASKNVPDLFMTGTYASGNHFADASADLSNLDLWKNVNPSAYPSVEFNNKKIAIPVEAQAFGIIYNKDVFEKAGIQTTPKTISELKQVCAALKEKNISPFVATYKDTWTVDQLLLFPLGIAPDTQSTFDQLTNHKIQLKDQAFMNNIVDFIDIYHKNVQDKPYETNAAQGATILAQGKAAMMVQGDWMEPQIKQANPDVHLGFIPIPFNNNANDSKLFVLNSIEMHVGKNSSHLKEAKEFVTWLATSKDAIDWYNKDMKVNAPFNGIEPSSGDLVSSELEIAKDSSKTAVWGQYFIPSQVLTPIQALNQKFIGNQITGQQWINSISDVWYNAQK